MRVGNREFGLDTLNLRCPFLIQLNWVGRQVFDLRVERSQLETSLHDTKPKH